MDAQQAAQLRDQAMRRTSVIGALVNLALTGLKVVFGIVGQSHALIADGIHSLADLSTDLMVWLAAKYSNQPADKEHPYGHARIETAFTVGLGVILLITAFGIVLDSAQRLMQPDTLLHPTPIALLAAAFSIIANEGLFHYTLGVARSCNSSLLTANAWHHRSDAISSIVVLIGVAGSLLGLPYLDAFAALGVAFMIGKIGWDQAWTSIRELIDTGMEPKTASALKRIIQTIDGVQGVHMLRSRRMGGAYLVDVHIVVSECLSVSEGHKIAEYVRLKLIDSHENIQNALVHIDPEDDSVAISCAGLPLRREVLQDLHKVWAKDIELAALDRVTLHYLNGQVHVDLMLNAQAVNTTDTSFSARLQKHAKALDYIGDVSVYKEHC